MTTQADVRAVSFDSGGQALIGRLHLPPRPAGSTAPPAIIVTGSWLTVKEQMPARYAPLLAEAGYAALTFDFRGFGESEGQPREVESTSQKAEDILAATRFLMASRDVDGGRVGSLAICASAGYVAMAAPHAPGLKSIAMVAPWLHDRALVTAIYGGEAAVAERLRQAREARERYQRDGVVTYVKAASNTDPTAAMYWEGDALDYYLNPERGAIPQWGGRFAVMAWKEWLELDAISLGGGVRVPTRVVTGDQTATPGGARAFADRLPAPHDVVSLPGTQFDFYDNPATVGAAAAAAVDHFRRTL